MAYNSAYTGAQIDEAVGAVRSKEAAWDGKQNAITGTQGQMVGFGEDGKPVAVDAPAAEAAAAETVTLTTAGWAEGSDGRYAQTVAVAGVSADTPVIVVDVALSGSDLDADAACLEAWKDPSANNVDQGSGTLTFHAYAVPSVNIPVNVGVC